MILAVISRQRLLGTQCFPNAATTKLFNTCFTFPPFSLLLLPCFFFLLGSISSLFVCVSVCLAYWQAGSLSVCFFSFFNFFFSFSSSLLFYYIPLTVFFLKNIYLCFSSLFVPLFLSFPFLVFFPSLCQFISSFCQKSHPILLTHPLLLFFFLSC